MKHISILGSTGSIGRNVLEVVRQYPGRFRVLGLAAGKNIKLLKDQVEAFHPQLISVLDQDLAEQLYTSLGPEWKNKIVWGQEGAKQIASLPGVEMVVSAFVGAAGLAPTYAAICAGKDIALANKETLVMAGELIMTAINKYNVNLLPVDSEHSAIFQSLAAGRRRDLHKIILTASGGPFRDKSEKDLWDVTPEQALNHPNWDMGNKISIDSASLMNKGLEVIEAKWLFDLELEQIEVLIHPQSIIHSMVEFIDGSIISQMGIPDMKTPISYALTYPARVKLNQPYLNLTLQEMTFNSPDFDKFPCLKLAYQAIKKGGCMPAVLNAANEIAVDAFLDKKIRFQEIALTVFETMKRIPNKNATDLTSILEVDLSARVQAESIIESLMINKQQKQGIEISSPDIPPGQNTNNFFNI